MYLFYLAQYAFNYGLSHYYLKKLEKIIEKEQRLIGSNNNLLIAYYMKKFLRYSKKCGDRQLKCEQLRKIIQNKYPSLRDES